MNHKPGTAAPVTGIYWCSVCKTPAQFTEGETLPNVPTCAAVACGNWCRSRSRAGAYSGAVAGIGADGGEVSDGFGSRLRAAQLEVSSAECGGCSRRNRCAGYLSYTDPKVSSAFCLTADSGQLMSVSSMTAPSCGTRRNSSRRSSRKSSTKVRTGPCRGTWR